MEVGEAALGVVVRPWEEASVVVEGLLPPLAAMAQGQTHTVRRLAHHHALQGFPHVVVVMVALAAADAIAAARKILFLPSLARGPLSLGNDQLGTVGVAAQAT